MTVATAWTRTTRKGRELWMMSDSRLNGGKKWDYGPKIFGIGRTDAVMAFAGETDWTYPLIAQITSYVESFVNLRDRVLDLVDAYDLIVDLLNESLDFVKDASHPSISLPKCSFIFAGYSSRRKDFIIRRIVFHSKNRRFESRNAREISGEYFTLIGDSGPSSAISRHLSQESEKSWRKRDKLDMRPAKAFYDVLRSKMFDSIGGAPQLVKVYEHSNIRHFGVYWPPEKPNAEQDIYLRGRRLRQSEALDHPWVYDPSSFKLFWHDFSPDTRAQNRRMASEMAAKYGVMVPEI